ncbi:protocadherin-10-like [Heterodontus francisci]|uniref:protocadherin-10-like n=1 Tax=Heterodontus francisci TaxID=7792 RepID=UPI00355C89B2
MANAINSATSFIFLLCVSDLISGQIRYSIPEELEHGAFVGNIAEDLSLNAHELSTRKFRMVSNDRKQYLEVNLENGIIFVYERIDREQLCRQSSTCSLSFQITLDKPLEMHRVAVEILDVNDNSPSFSKNEYALRIIEVIAPGTRLPLESAHDPDVGKNAIRTYQISPNEHFSLRVQTRNDGSKSAELLLEKPLDREQQSTIYLLLTAIDGGSPQRSGTARIVITIMDANDNAPVFDHETYRTNVLENTPKGTLVIKVNAVDLDEGTNAELTYSFTSHASQKARDLFKLDPRTGEIRVEGVLDFEESNMCELDVEAMDKGSYAMAAHAKVMVGLIDMNDNMPEIEVTSVSSTVPEDTQPGTVIATISVRDADSGENGQVQCEVDMDIPFKFQKSLSNSYKLVTNNILDRETTALYNISISARDRGSPPLATNKNIMVSVSDVNDNPPKFTQSSYNVFVTENNTPGASIFAVTALDPDLDQNGQVSYFMLENQIKYMSAFPYIAINSKSGNINALLSFDYEQLKNFQINVQAQDSGSPPQSSTAIVNIIILDQNDNAPIIVSPLACNSSSAIEIVRQSLYPGYLVTKVIATDADSGQNMRLSFQMLEATDPSLFSVGLLSGEIRAARRFKEQDATTQRAVIMVKDNGQPSLSSSATIFFSVLSNVTEKLSVQSHQPRNTEHFSDLHAYLIIIFGSTTFIFLVTIIFLVMLKCKQGRNTNHCHPTRCCCCRRSNSNDVFNPRTAPKEFLNYPVARQTLPNSESYHYTVCLSPESSRSDFLFLKPYEATLPLNDLNARDSSVRK